MITGAVKFFDRNFSLLKLGASAVASSNNDSINFILDVSKWTQWESIGSNDSTTETITITFPSAKTIERLFLVGINFKEFQVKYKSGAPYVDFANAIGVNSEVKGIISETDYSRDTAYYEFDAVSTTSIQITVLKTQIANEEKYINQVIATTELGTFRGFPRVKPASDKNETKAKTLSSKIVVQKTFETASVDITFKSHPYNEDNLLINLLVDREEPFLVWLCGGRVGTTYFKSEQVTWRLQDIYNMQTFGELKNEFEKGVYTLGFNKTLRLEEHI